MLPFRQIYGIPLGNYALSTWGTLLILAFIILTVIAFKYSSRIEKLDKTHLMTLAGIAFIGGILGSRAACLIQHQGFSITNLFDFSLSCFSSLGAFIAVGILSIAYTTAYKLNTLKFADTFAFAAPAAYIVFRIGCYLVGDHLGKPTSLPWAIQHAGELRHPVIGYTILSMIPIILLFVHLRNKKPTDGFFSFSFIAYYSITRFGLDFFRADATFAGLTIVQWIAIPAFLLTAAWLIKNKEKIKRGAGGTYLSRA
jgi:phosphatidylglycerol---prolipoprotein diacylglyceryl transferase